MKKRIFGLLMFALAITATPSVFTSCDSGSSYNYYEYTPNNAVLKAFAAKFPKATSIGWYIGSNYTSVVFLDNGVPREAMFSNTGVWLITESEFGYNSLPPMVVAGFEASIYANWRVEDVSVLERIATTEQYVIGVENGNDDLTLLFSPDGMLSAVAEDDYNTGISDDLSKNILHFISTRYYGALVVGNFTHLNGEIEVDIYDKSMFKELIFKHTNDWLYTRWSVSISDVPQPVKDELSKPAYDGYISASAMFYDNSTNEYYEFVLTKSGSADMIVRIAPDGTVVEN